MGRQLDGLLAGGGGTHALKVGLLVHHDLQQIEQRALVVDDEHARRGVLTLLGAHEAKDTRWPSLGRSLSVPLWTLCTGPADTSNGKPPGDKEEPRVFQSTEWQRRHR